MSAKSEEKEESNGELEFMGSSAFLGPTLWDKTLSDFKLEYMDLDEFLQENGIPHSLSDKASPQSSSPGTSPSCDLSHTCFPTKSFTSPTSSCQESHRGDPLTSSSDQETHVEEPQASPVAQVNHTSQLDCNFSTKDLALACVPGQIHFDPSRHSFSDDELRPQPMLKKSKKHLVPDDLKNEKYWARRSKNNVAAKRSREARRIKENQIVLRASFLEKENTALKEEVNRLKDENVMLLECLKKYEMI
ncbi:thyrotroph embryonic factor-like [Limulus polyphemus]|uniref:Thyrotroph embryonic factor-like n=1 Tax=Limulus polyphemus TaxID=6850 RepID=A0ABM1BRK1_LIMPO|nr:thyrotroph embryonic factor-like [Limulus polyphemus]